MIDPPSPDPLKYRNKRPDYVSAWWNVVDWDRAEELYTTSNE